MDKYCPRCGALMKLQSDGTYRCDTCGYVSSSQFVLQADTQQTKG